MMGFVAFVIAGTAILAWGIALILDLFSLGTRFINHAARTAKFSWQREVNPNNTFVRSPTLNRVAFGVMASLIGAIWLGAALYSLVS
jgi:hypothetical protein